MKHRERFASNYAVVIFRSWVKREQSQLRTCFQNLARAVGENIIELLRSRHAQFALRLRQIVPVAQRFFLAMRQNWSGDKSSHADEGERADEQKTFHCA